MWQKSGRGSLEVRTTDLGQGGRADRSRRPSGSAGRPGRAPRDDRAAHGGADRARRRPPQPLPEALVGRRVGFGDGGRAGPWLLHPGDPRGEDASDRSGDAQRAHLPDVDVPVRRLRRVRGNDQLPQGRLHLHARLREPDARSVRGTDGQPRGDRVGVLVLVRDGGDARGVHDARGDRGSDRLQQRAVRRRLLAVHEGHAAVRRHGRPGGSARPGRGRRRAPGRGVLLRRDDREPQRHRRGSRGAWARCVARTACRPSSTTRSRRRTWPTRRVGGSSTSCTRRRSSSGGTTT